MAILVCTIVLLALCIALAILAPHLIIDVPEHPDLFCEVKQAFGSIEYSTSACVLLAMRQENGPVADWEEDYLLKSKNGRYFQQSHWWNDGYGARVNVRQLTEEEATILFHHSAWQRLVSFEKAFNTPLVEA